MNRIVYLVAVQWTREGNLFRAQSLYSKGSGVMRLGGAQLHNPKQ